MKRTIFYLLYVVTFLIADFAVAQEGMPIYSDYLTDNYYLLHPSMAGAANCAQVRVTARKNWVGQKDAPGLFTAAYNGRVSEQSAIGVQMYNDKNGFSSQTGGFLTYAHHLMFSRNEIDLNMLSFGLNAGIIQYRLDQTQFVGVDPDDPLIASGSVSSSEFNMDVGLSYNLYNFYAHATMKNLLRNSGINNDIRAANDLRNLLVSVGYVFERGNRKWSFEPSVLFFRRFSTKQSLVDVNLKAYHNVNFGRVWGGVSYRTSLDGVEFIEGTRLKSQKLSHVTPFVGVNFKKLMVAYTYSYQSNPVVFNSGGFHQITLGLDFSCRPKRYQCYCPAVN